MALERGQREVVRQRSRAPFLADAFPPLVGSAELAWQIIKRDCLEDHPAQCTGPRNAHFDEIQLILHYLITPSKWTLLIRRYRI